MIILWMHLETMNSNTHPFLSHTNPYVVTLRKHTIMETV